MLQDKITKKISEIGTDFNENTLDSQHFLSSFKALKLTGSFSEFNYFKKDGYSFQLVLSVLILFTLRSFKTVNSSLHFLQEQGISMGKDVFFRLKNKCEINWRMILWRIVSLFVAQTQDGVNHIRCLIFDDTLLEKTGKRIEKIGKVFDHVDNSFKLGFKMLSALYWDGKSSIPVDFAFFREKGKREDKPFGMSQKDLRKQYCKKRLKGTGGKQREDELDKSKIEVMLQMFYMSVYQSLKIDYVLCDSWFTCQGLINAVRSQKIHLIGMYKFVKTLFTYQGKQMNYKQIMDSITDIKRCRSMRLHYKRANVLLDGEAITLFFSRQGKNGKWKVLLTTDTSLNFVKLIEIYQIRWTIEVFFKDMKQKLNLGGCQSRNFNAQIADTTISMIAYILLAFRRRFEHYESMGELFRAMNAEQLEQTLDKRLWGLFLEMLNEICYLLEIDVEDMFEKMLTNPKIEKLVVKMLAPPLPEAV